jgi:hypothetical protein
VQAGQEHASTALDRVGHHGAVRELQSERLVDQLGRELEKLGGKGPELLGG